MKKIVIGILAHVDSGKTTLAEAMLYLTGQIRKLGRVDHRNSFFDTGKIERDRGITVFSKQAQFKVGDVEFTMLDTPGHIDFSAETERTLQVLDMAVLVISGTDGVQSHTETLWRLLKKYNIPVFIFVNKMDMAGADKSFVINDLTAHLSGDCIDFSFQNDEFYEKLSVCSEDMMNMYLENNMISDNFISAAIEQRLVFPCFFGSALKIEGIREFIASLGKYAVCPPEKSEFSAKIFKITDDGNGGRLTHMKITGGRLNVRDLIEYKDKSGQEFSEKISRIRIYSGEKFNAAEFAEQGTVCAVMGLSAAYAGQGLGCETDNDIIMLEPVLAYKIISDTDSHTLMKYLRILEDEDPMLNVSVNRSTGEIYLKLMGEIQKEVISGIISERFGLSVSFGEASISYKETIAEPVEGVGHYEPLRHYAEVHVMLSPLPSGSGLVFDTQCSEDILDRNWQRLILTHLKEKVHKGILTCSPITDMKLTLISGRAHLKHTEGGDFRQATYRAVRNGLRRAESILLEPWYEFRLEVPSECTGRALSDISDMCGRFDAPDVNGDMTVICGYAPVSEMRSYHTDAAGYTGGRGRLSCTLSGYEKCHNADEVIEKIGYNCDNDTDNTADSVFCSHGAGYVVKWDDVENHMHIPYADGGKSNSADDETDIKSKAADYCRRAADDKELMEIFERTYGKINRDRRYVMHTPKPVELKEYKPSNRTKRKKYLLVDGYNIIFAWDELKKLAGKSLDLARAELINILANYQSFAQCEIIIVFDAYKVKESAGSVEKLYNISIVYTKSAETADTYIERASHELSRDNNVCVATSDGTEQIIIMGNGAYRISAADLHSEVKTAEKAIREYMDGMR